MTAMSQAYMEDLSGLENREFLSPFPQGRSYSKSCPVQIELRGSDKPPLIGFAVLDDQASVSMVDPQVADYFNLVREGLPKVSYSLSTLERNNSPHTGLGVTGLQVRRIFGEEVSPSQMMRPGMERKLVQLPMCIESVRIPEVREEIPDPEDVRGMFGEDGDWMSLGGKFPRKDPSWTTLLLLGRNCKKAMEVKHFVRGREGRPHAVETGLR